MEYFVNGIILGFAYLMPIGAQNLYVINSALTNTFWQSFITTIIIIAFDISLALGAYFGIGTIIEVYPPLEGLILGIGGLILLHMGMSLILSKRQEIEQEEKVFSIKKVIIMAFTVAWLNPQAIIDSTMLFGAIQVTLPEGMAKYFLIGMMISSTLWFSSLTFISALFHNKITPKVLLWINRICGVFIAVYGCHLLYELYKKIF